MHTYVFKYIHSLNQSHALSTCSDWFAQIHSITNTGKIIFGSCGFVCLFYVFQGKFYNTQTLILLIPVLGCVCVCACVNQQKHSLNHDMLQLIWQVCCKSHAICYLLWEESQTWQELLRWWLNERTKNISVRCRKHLLWLLSQMRQIRPCSSGSPVEGSPGVWGVWAPALVSVLGPHC